MSSSSGHIAIGAEVWRKAGLWRLRLTGPEWLLADLARELDETGQQLDILAAGPQPAGMNFEARMPIYMVEIAPAPRKPGRARKRSSKGAE